MTPFRTLRAGGPVLDAVPPSGAAAPDRAGLREDPAYNCLIQEKFPSNSGR